MESLVGSGVTGVLVVSGLIIHDLVKNYRAKKNGRASGVMGFTDADRATLLKQQELTIETSKAIDKMHDVLKDLNGTVGNINEWRIRADERDKMRTRQEGGAT